MTTIVPPASWAEAPRVWVERTKYPDVPHYGVQGVVLGDDEHGRWVGVGPGHPVVRGDEVLFVGPEALVLCVAHTGWYMVHHLVGHEIDVYVDIVSPPAWDERGASMVDLDLDLVVRGGAVELVDEDEFEIHQVTYDYPAELVTGARAAAIDLLGRVRAGEPPFSQSSAAPWLSVLDDLLAGS